MADGLNIPSGESLLGQQQEFAAQEPYKNIAANPTGTFMNAFLAMTQIGNQRRKLEQALQMAYMKNDMDEREFRMKMDNSATTHAIAIARLQQTGENQAANQMLDQKKFDWAVQKQNDRIAGSEAILDVERELAAEGITPDSPNSKYWTEYSSRVNARAAAAPASTFNKALALAGKRVNDASDRMLKDNIAQKNALQQEVGTTIFGDPKFQDMRPVINYQDLPDEKTGGQSTWDWLTGSQGAPAKSTGNKLYEYQTSAGPQTAKIPASRLADLNKRWNELQEQGKKINPKVPTGMYQDETVTIKDSNGKQWQIPQNQIEAAKKRDPGIVIVP